MAAKLRVLVAYSATSTFVQTTYDYLDSFRKFLGAEVDYLHVSNDAIVPGDLNYYDVIINSYCARFCIENHISKSYYSALRSFGGVKILAVQDEYDNTNVLKREIKSIGFDIVLTCVPQDTIEYVYPVSEFPNIKFVTVLTGYVPESLVAMQKPLLPLAERPILIGYRGRNLGAAYGKLGFLKYEIGRRMRDLCDERGLHHDIAMDEESRIYGSAWFDFIGQCRVMLGSESGSNVFDFDGSIQRQYRALVEANGGHPIAYHDFLPFIQERENEIQMGQVSPRVFECAVMRTPMVLFRGRYSDVVQPEVHYIPLDVDFSNADDVLQRIQNVDALAEMAERAYTDIVASGRFGYQSFVSMIGSLIEEAVAIKRRHRSIEAPAVPAAVPFERHPFIEMPSPEIKSLDYVKAVYTAWSERLALKQQEEGARLARRQQEEAARLARQQQEEALHQRLAESKLWLEELNARETFAASAYIETCDWAEEETRQVKPFAIILWRRIRNARRIANGLRNLIERLKLEAKEFAGNGIASYQTDNAQGLNDQTEQLRIIEARTSKVIGNISMLNHEYNVLCSAVMDMKSAHEKLRLSGVFGRIYRSAADSQR